MTVWFTVKLDDRPGSLARVAAALGDRGVNITGIVGVAEDTDGALMLTTSDPVATRAAFTDLGLPFEEHDPTGGHRARLDDGRRPSPGGRRPRFAGLMPKRRAVETAAIRFDIVDEASSLPSVTSSVGRPGWADPGARDRPPDRRRPAGGRDRARGRGRHRGGARRRRSRRCPNVRTVHLTRALDRVFGKRIIVVGGGAQVAQVALGAVSEADRHNLRGERISVDTIPLVGEEDIAAAVRAVADLPRARLLVLAGSIMGGDISVAAEELRAVGIPIIALNMVGSITDHVDLVVSDPVQAGTMAVMAVADTASFDLERQRGRRY